MSSTLPEPVRAPEHLREALAASSIAQVLAAYVSTANARDLAGLLELYAPNPTLLIGSAVLSRDLSWNLRRALGAWSAVQARFAEIRVTSLELTDDHAELACVIPSSGRFLGFSRSFDFHKRLELTRSAPADSPEGDPFGGWRILRDETRESGLVSKILKLAGFA